tara:strand:- start:122 stop:529 length:408 start_codon:yes stop_codon:yes gene_type:complete
MNKVILTLLLAGFGTQLIKMISLWIKHQKFNWHDLIVTGGMPSSHSAFVVSLATIIYLVEGATSTFAVSLVFAFVVIRDAFGVRRTVGDEGHILVQVMKKLKIKTKSHFSVGHTPLQVFVGSIVGFIVAVLVYLV